ncbi:hypothetical protein VFC49_02520 [Thermococcus sp. SY098]|uniref:hypothetical protein n=1 Tax=Thermococcus sp. SY098 TaxID=3111325 RepID=UPI002D782673|nr:hypothetical protein [Thermococcus sp. SY098]WRS53039.1 hypothetical protein VFC49_02520 [Thermococcus sp. SY098]
MIMEIGESMRKLFGSGLIIGGTLYLVFLLTIYPHLVGGYGGGEQMILTHSNQFTDALYLNGDISVKLTSNTPFTVKIDGEKVGEFKMYSARFKGEHLIEVESNQECIVYVELRQHPSIIKYAISLVLIGIGSLILASEKEQKIEVNTGKPIL